MVTRKSNILIVDDHALFRRGLKEILSEGPDFGQIDEAGSGAEAIAKFEAGRYACVLLDIFMPGENGIEIIQRLKAIRPDAHCLVLSMYSMEQYGVRAIKAGAAGYLTKNAAPDILKEAVRRICSGGKYIDNLLAETLAQEIQGVGGRPHDKLSNRELQVMVMIASGKSASQVARELFLSVKTIGSHRANILRKLGLTGTTGLIQYAIKNGLIDLPRTPQVKP